MLKRGTKVKITVSLKNKIFGFLVTGFWPPKYGVIKYWRDEMIAYEVEYSKGTFYVVPEKVEKYE